MHLVLLLFVLASGANSHDPDDESPTPEQYRAFRESVREIAKSEEKLNLLFSYANQPTPGFSFVDAAGQIAATEVPDFANAESDEEESSAEVEYITDRAPLRDQGEFYTDRTPLLEDESYADETPLRDEVEYYTDRTPLQEQVQEQMQELLEDPPCDERGRPLQVGSVRGVPGVNFPNYEDIPITSFTCADKKHVPGFYADLETGCQVFHVCWPHRRESFLCPIGTTFNQAILACDYWYSTNCSLSPLYYEINAFEPETSTSHVGTMVDALIEVSHTESPVTQQVSSESPAIFFPETGEEWIPEDPSTEDLKEVSQVMKFLPVKSKVVVYPRPVQVVVPVEKSEPRLVVKPKHHKSKHAKGHQDVESHITHLVREILGAAGKVAKDITHKIPELKLKHKPQSVKFVKPKTKLIRPQSDIRVLPVRPKMKLVKVKPHVKVHVQLPKVDHRFVVKPVAEIKYRPIKKIKYVVPRPVVTLRKPLKVYKTKGHLKTHFKGRNVPGLVMSALNSAGSVFQHDVLPLTRHTLAESHVKLVKTKNH